MRNGTVALALCGVMLAASAAAAQELPVDFTKARQLFVDKQYRASARELSMASSAFRGEIGKCKDVAVGEKMLAGEGQIDKLAKDVADGKIESVKVLDGKLTEFDLLLAKNHQQLAFDQLRKSHNRSLADVGNDLGLAAGFFKRAMQWKHESFTPEMQKAYDDAMRVSQALNDNPEKEPSGASAVIEALGKWLKT
jgi:hypothetical protein